MLKKSFVLLLSVLMLCLMFTGCDSGGSNDDTEETILPGGALAGKFSVSATKVVHFSQGNLQATLNSPYDDYIWRFANKQYDYIGNAAGNSNISSLAIGDTVDLFGWSSDGSGAGVGFKPSGINSSVDNADYHGSFKDWGTESISDSMSGWTTLTSDEWTYLLETRTDAANKWAFATVCGKPGIVLLPDEWELPVEVTFTPGKAGGWTTNEYNAEKWSDMEDENAVFLPAVGSRLGDSVSSPTFGQYWSASPLSDVSKANSFNFNATIPSPYDLGIFDTTREAGCSVRLVIDANIH